MDGRTATLVDQEWMGVHRLWWIRNGWAYSDFGGPGMDECTVILVDHGWVYSRFGGPGMDECTLALVDPEWIGVQ